MGKINGNDLSVGESGSQQNWEFHDWYWSFRMKRTWAKQQHQYEDGDCADAPPIDQPSRTAQVSGSKSAIRSQLAGLRHRAAIRSTARKTAASAPSSCSSFDFEEEERHIWEEDEREMMERAEAVQDQASGYIHVAETGDHSWSSTEPGAGDSA